MRKTGKPRQNKCVRVLTSKSGTTEYDARVTLLSFVSSAEENSRAGKLSVIKGEQKDSGRR
jgi:hypothetical protein